jgi:hypothetical protein
MDYHENQDVTNNFVALVRERTIPINRPPLVGEISASFFADRGVSRSQQGESLKPQSRFIQDVNNIINL